MKMFTMTRMAALAVSLFTASLGMSEAHAAQPAPVMAKNVVLVHGAWADAQAGPH